MCQIFTVFYFVTILIPMFRFKIRKLFIYFKSIKQQKKLWYHDHQSLLQCKYLISHHGGQLIATHCLLCNYHLFSFFPITIKTTTTAYEGGGGVGGRKRLWWGRGRGRNRRPAKILRAPLITITTTTTTAYGGGVGGRMRLGLGWGQGRNRRLPEILRAPS